MTHYPIAEIDLAALRHNLAIAYQHTHSKILVMVKADAYGHGMLKIAQALPEVNGFGVARLPEALALRSAGITQMILLMEGALNTETLVLAAEKDLALVVHSDWQIELLEKFVSSRALTVWLKLDIGMHRLGFLPEQAEAAYQRLLQCTAVKKPLYTIAHFSHADEPASHVTEQQAARFFSLTQHWLGEKSLARSAALLAFPATQMDWVRLGIMLYGVSPFAEKTLIELNLKPVMTLQTKVIAIRQFKQGEPVGYNGTYICPENMRVAIVAIGYGDGYPCHAKSGTPVLIRGKKLPLIGRVSMDTIVVDLRLADEVQLNDKVILWGKGLPVEIVAQWADTIPYELFCRLTSRIKFIYR